MQNYSYLSDSVAKKIYDHFYGLKQIIPFRGYPISRGENLNPFFIIGSGRSGNTLLRRILYAHPEIHIPPETYMLGRAIRVFRQNRHLAWKDLVYLTLCQFYDHEEFETFNLELRPLVDKLLLVPSELRSLNIILDKFYRYHAEIQGNKCNRWGDKTPLNTFFLDLIFDVFPKAQFIHIIRDGCDVVSSYLKAGIYKTIDDSANRWVNSVNLASKFVEKHQNTCIEVRYEALVTNPEQTIAEICSFLGIDCDNSILYSHEHANKMGDVAMRSHHKQVFEPISASSIGKGRKQLSHQEKILIQKIIGKNLEKFGYDPCIDLININDALKVNH